MRRISRRNNGPDEEWILLNYSYIIRHLLQSSRNSWSLLANIKDNSSNYKNFFIKSRISSKTLRILNFLEEILGGTRFEVFWWEPDDPPSSQKTWSHERFQVTRDESRSRKRVLSRMEDEMMWADTPSEMGPSQRTMGMMEFRKVLQARLPRREKRLWMSSKIW